MGLLEDVGSSDVAGKFLGGLQSARQFRIQRQNEAQRRAIQERQLQIQEAELQNKLSKQQEERATRAEIRKLTDKYYSVLKNPTAGVWDLKNGTITEKAKEYLAPIVAEIMSIDPRTGGDYLAHLNFIYNPPKPPEAKPNAVVEKYEGLKAIGYSEDRARRLAGGEKEDASSTDGPGPDVSQIAPFMKVLENQGLDPDKVPDAMIRETFKTYTKSVQDSDKRLESKVRPTQPALPGAPSVPTDDIPDPTDEAEVSRKIADLKGGLKPFKGYKQGRGYLQKARKAGFLDEPNYAKAHQILSPAYPDTTK